MTLREKVATMLDNSRFEELTDLGHRNKGVFRHLIALTYNKESAICWRAIEAIGKITGVISQEHPEVVRNLIQRLLWSMREESGGIGWSMAEILGEIIRNSPDIFSDILPIVVSFHEEEMFRAGVLRAIGRIGSISPALVNANIPLVRFYLDDHNPDVRASAAWTLGQLKADEGIDELQRLLNDCTPVTIYDNGELFQMTVGEVARKAMAMIKNNGENEKFDKY
ncbi:MAG: HEAT repeat domain-containing protein [Nitrospirae bacterium]|nr:HEAT repeat domain-containing protein [Nitrospirota bacterium]